MFTLLSHVIIEHIFTNYIVYYFLLFHVMSIICHFIIRSFFSFVIEISASTVQLEKGCSIFGLPSNSLFISVTCS